MFIGASAIEKPSIADPLSKIVGDELDGLVRYKLAVFIWVKLYTIQQKVLVIYFLINALLDTD